MSVQKDKSERKKSLVYSDDFRAMLERLEEEDNAEKGQQLMKKNRLCVETVKSLEKHFEEENKLQPERKLKIAEEVGLEPRQVAIWFQNRRARWRTKQLEREYDGLRASYDALKHDYGSLEQEKLALLAQLKDLKAKIEARNSIKSVPLPMEDSNNVNVIIDENNCVNVPLSASLAPSPCSTTTYDPFSMAPSTSMPLSMDAFQLYRAYQDQLLKMEELGVHTNNNINNELSSGNFFSVDQAPTLNFWYNNDQFF